MLPRGLFNLVKLQSAKAIPTTRGITTTPANKGLENILKSIPKESAQKTQSVSTVPTYKKVEKEFLPEGKRLDYGAGRGLGAKEIKADTFEPFPRKGFNPTFKNTDDIPSSSYENISSLNVLNVLQQNDRKKAVKEIGRILKPGGNAIISTRGMGVLTEAPKGTKGIEPMSVITSKGTYQKGFKPKELKDYVQKVLGKNFDVDLIKGQKIGAASIKIKKLEPKKMKTGGMVEKNNYNYNTQRTI